MTETLDMTAARTYCESLEKLIPAWKTLNDRSRELTKIDLEASRRFKRAMSLKPKECFYNAQTLAMTFPNLTYYEGHATGSIIPVPHGWVVDERHPDVVIDPTWVDLETVDGGRPAPDYFGMPIPTEFISQHWIETGMSTDLIPYYLDSLSD